MINALDSFVKDYRLHWLAIIPFVILGVWLFVYLINAAKLYCHGLSWSEDQEMILDTSSKQRLLSEDA